MALPIVHLARSEILSHLLPNSSTCCSYGRGQFSQLGFVSRAMSGGIMKPMTVYGQEVVVEDFVFNSAMEVDMDGDSLDHLTDSAQLLDHKPTVAELAITVVIACFLFGRIISITAIRLCARFAGPAMDKKEWNFSMQRPAAYSDAWRKTTFRWQSVATTY